MKDLRFKVGVALSAPYVLFYAIPRAHRMLAPGSGFSAEEKFTFGRDIMVYMRRHFRTTTYVFGLRNIPEQDGFAVYGNHQGKYDAIGVTEALGRQTSLLWEKRSSDRILAREVCGLVDGVKIDLQNLRNAALAIRSATEKVSSGKNILIFPEGGYTDNCNTLQTFKTGCFQVSLRSHTPMVPVVLYDSYRSMNTNRFGPVRTQIHFLPPIPYEEFSSFRSDACAALLREKIEGKLNELKAMPDPYDPDFLRRADEVLTV